MSYETASGGVSATTRSCASRPAQVAADMHLNPGRGTGRVVGLKVAAESDDIGLSLLNDCRPRTAASVSGDTKRSPSHTQAVRYEERGPGSSAIRITARASGDRAASSTRATGLHRTRVAGVSVAATPHQPPENQWVGRGCGSTSIFNGDELVRYVASALANDTPTARQGSRNSCALTGRGVVGRGSQAAGE